MNVDDASVVSFTFLQLQVLLEHSISHLFGHHLLNHYDIRDAHTRSKTVSQRTRAIEPPPPRDDDNDETTQRDGTNRRAIQALSARAFARELNDAPDSPAWPLDHLVIL